MGLNKAFTIEIDELLNMRAALGAAKSGFVTEKLALIRPAVGEKIKDIEAAIEPSRACRAGGIMVHEP